MQTTRLNRLNNNNSEVRSGAVVRFGEHWANGSFWETVQLVIYTRQEPLSGQGSRVNFVGKYYIFIIIKNIARWPSDLLPSSGPPLGWIVIDLCSGVRRGHGLVVVGDITRLVPPQTRRIRHGHGGPTDVSVPVFRAGPKGVRHYINGVRSFTRTREKRFVAAESAREVEDLSWGTSGQIGNQRSVVLSEEEEVINLGLNLGWRCCLHRKRFPYKKKSIVHGTCL